VIQYCGFQIKVSLSNKEENGEKRRIMELTDDKIHFFDGEVK